MDYTRALVAERKAADKLAVISASSQAQPVIEAHARYLRADAKRRASLEGHTDDQGGREYNLALGERRANAARDYLVSRGVNASRFTTVSYGEERPKADNKTAEGRAMNRRAALVVKIQ